jgi:hypothetical protein
MLDVPPKPLFVVSRLVKKQERFPFVQSLVVSFEFPEHFQQVQLK